MFASDLQNSDSVIQLCICIYIFIISVIYIRIYIYIYIYIYISDKMVKLEYFIASFNDKYTAMEKYDVIWRA